MLSRVASLLGIAGIALLSACSSKGGEPERRGSTEASEPHDASAEATEPLASLRAFEQELHHLTDHRSQLSSRALLGPDPYVLRSLPARPGSKARFVSVLRGHDAIVALDGALHEIGRAPAPASPAALAIAPDGDIFVAGELSSRVDRLRLRDLRGEPGFDVVARFELPGEKGLRDLAVGPRGLLYLVEEYEGRLLVVSPSGAKLGQTTVGKGPYRIRVVGSHLIVACVLDHTLTVYPLDGRGLPIEEKAVKIRHDGPFWGFDASVSEGFLFIFAGGVEDHPLDRSIGSFGYIDSFVFLYRISVESLEPLRLASINVSDLGVVTPKAILLERTKEGLSGVVAGYGSALLLELAWGADLRAPPAVKVSPCLPGASMVEPMPGGGLAFADPLLDGFFVRPESANALPSFVPAKDGDEDESSAKPPLRSKESRLGEALVFTTLMAPWNRAEGPLSRFTCETCHLEGYIDGRVHPTGRGDVRATTKPLLGLFNNRPHFSRALDPDLATVAMNEFRVAGAGSGHDPFFPLSLREAPWLRELGVTDEELDPVSLRKAFMAFFKDFTPRSNPVSYGRHTFDALERRGAEIFRRHCEFCHEARSRTDSPFSRIEFAAWESAIFTPSDPIVWAKDEYKQTGVVPYVHERGARVPSLRSLYKKWPFFTNGSAKSLDEVLERIRLDEAKERFFHDGAPEGAALKRLDEAERRALRAFLDLL